jgi:uncharacterized OB-fold protein
MAAEKLSHQRAYQERHRAAGKCQQCPKRAVKGRSLCPDCRRKSREKCRERYRAAHPNARRNRTKGD